MFGFLGGKDFFVMLYILMCMMLCYLFGIFIFVCAIVDFGIEAFNFWFLIFYVEFFGIEYYYFEEEIMVMVDVYMIGDSICVFCVCMKWGVLYMCCCKYGYNKFVLV